LKNGDIILFNCNQIGHDLKSFLKLLIQF
jgi:hypothetical protein